ncbi:MAG TPA: alkaline phytoceramidase [Planctomycetota bacterium]|nr:alkaline phytoceramidase [Planctomycetota bacterium]
MSTSPLPWFHGPRERSLAIALATGLAALLIVVAFLPRLPQDEDYHRFADCRCWLGVSNTADVLSNAPFALVGIVGLWLAARRRTPERAAWLTFFVAVAATAIGSGYYHLAPDTPRLFWDRLPMTVAFMALTAAIAGARLGPRLGRWLLAPLVVAGAASAVYWRQSELAGAGDLRWYAMVQFAPMLAIPLVIALTPRRDVAGRDIAMVIALYALSKLLEWLDAPVLELIGVSGHTLKHLAAAAATGWVAWMLRRPAGGDVVTRG